MHGLAETPCPCLSPSIGTALPCSPPTAAALAALQRRRPRARRASRRHRWHHSAPVMRAHPPPSAATAPPSGSCGRLNTGGTPTPFAYVRVGRRHRVTGVPGSGHQRAQLASSGCCDAGTTCSAWVRTVSGRGSARPEASCQPPACRCMSPTAPRTSSPPSCRTLSAAGSACSRGHSPPCRCAPRAVPCGAASLPADRRCRCRCRRCCALLRGEEGVGPRWGWDTAKRAALRCAVLRCAALCCNLSSPPSTPPLSSQTEQWFDVELGIRLNTPGQVRAPAAPTSDLLGQADARCSGACEAAAAVRALGSDAPAPCVLLPA